MRLLSLFLALVIAAPVAGPAAGASQLVASYGGDGDSNPSTSFTRTHVVASPTLIPTATTLAVTPNPVPAGAPTTFVATVSPIPSTGDIQWLIDGAPAGTTPVGADGRASTSFHYDDPGNHTIQAHFVEGTIYADSLSDTVPLTVSPVTYVVTLTADPPIVECYSFQTHLTATVSPPAEGTVRFYSQYQDGSSDQLLSSKAVVGGQATFDPDMLPGTSTYRADFIPAGATSVAGSATTVVQCRDRPTVMLAANRDTAVSGETLVTFTARFGLNKDAGGTVTFRDVTGSTPAVLGTANIVPDPAYTQYPHAVLNARLTGAGVHAIDAVYSGNESHFPATSNPVAITVSPDVGVSASGVGVSYAMFYPYKDGYRDTVAMRGTPGEPVSVTVRVYNSSGRRVRSWSLATRSSAWSLAWNGRTASGIRLAAGTYKVVQKLRDALGHTKSFTAYTTISNKRLYWHTGSQTKYGASFSRAYATKSAWVAPNYSSFYRGVDLYGNSGDEYAYCEYRFTLPSGTVYKSLKLSVLGRPKGGRTPGFMSFYNTTGMEDGLSYSGYSHAWYSSSVSGTNHVNASHVVRTWYTTRGWDRARYDIAKVKLTYTYGVLK